MASLDLSDLIPNLLRETTPPGGDLYPTATEDQLLGFLQDGFWEARLDGFLLPWAENDGIVTPVTVGQPDIPRDLQQIVIMYAGMKLVRTAILNTQTLFRAVAGPVEFETNTSATVLRELLKELQDRRERLILRLADAGIPPYFVYIDGVFARDLSLRIGNSFWVD